MNPRPSKPLAFLFSISLVLGLACERKHPAQPSAHAHDDHEGHSHEASGHDSHGEAPGAQVALAGLRGVQFRPAPSPVSEGAWIPGEAAADEGSGLLLSSPVKGILTGLPIAPGQSVQVGTVLAVLQSPELARLKADWSVARAKLERIQADLAREERIFKAGAGSKRELEAAQSEQAAARAEEEAARLALEARGLKPEEAGSEFRIRAPRTGMVTNYKVMVGQGVEAGQELGSFQASQARLVKLELPLPGPARWMPGIQTEVRSPAGWVWKAKVEGLPSVLSAETRRLAYRLRLQGSQLPLPGTPVEVRVPMEKAILLPQGALQRLEGQWGVFLQKGESAVFRSVKRGPELGGEVMILEGIQTGEVVAVEGAYLLKALVLKRTQPQEDGHAH